MFGGSSCDYSNKVVLITGGTRGIGAVTAQTYLKAGARVIVTGRTPPDSLPAVGDARADFMALDLADHAGMTAVFDGIVERYGRLDVLVNNAGGTPHVPAATSSPRLVEGIVRLNLVAPFWAAQKANAIMQAQEGGGVILFVASVSGLRPSPGTAAYGAAKAGIINLVQSLALEWAPRVRVVSVTPGLVHTESALDHYGGDEGIAAVARTIPLQRMARPDDIAQACLYLTSPNASYVTGANLVVHGGGEAPAYLAAAAGAAT